MYKLTLEQENLINENIKLAYYIAQKWYKKLNYNRNAKFLLDELISDCLLGMIKAAKTFDIDRGVKFSTYVTRVMENEILMSMRQKRKINEKLISSFQIVNNENGETYNAWDVIQKDYLSPNEIDQFIEIDSILNSMKVLNKREKMILILKYRGLNQKAISKKIGYTQSYISRILSNAQKKVYKELKK